MRTFILATVSAVSMTAGNALYVNRAQAVPMFNGLQDAAPASNIENVQFFFGGRRYCWLLDGKGPAGTGAAMLAAWLRLGRRPWLAWLEFSGSCRWPMAVTVVATVRMMVTLVPGVSVAKVAIAVVAAVQVVTKVAVGTEKTARSKRASPRPHHDRERL